MFGKRRHLATLVAMVLATPAIAAQQETSQLELMREDAELADVCFVSPQKGWAVGDRGVIWHTSDGGRSWLRQQSRVECRLECVTFADERNGWAAGGYTHPYSHVSEGVVLRTRDGGQTWKVLPRALLPALRRIKFFDAKRAVAFGRPSALFPAGVFTTDSGGEHFAPLPAQKAPQWLAGDFVDRSTGALAGRAGAAFVVRRGTLAPARSASFGLRALRRMELAEPVGGWLVGDGGLILKTADLGQSWQTPNGALPENVADHFDFSALAVRGDRCWVAGSPGTRIFHTADAGRTWSAYNTGQPLPIHSLAFVDDSHGWAVGALGTILATTDGGKTWARQRAGGSRVAMLGLYGQAERVPLDLFARLSAAEGYLGAVSVIGGRRADDASTGGDDLPDRTHEALVAVGACGAESAWRFPLGETDLALSVGQVLAALDRINDGAAREKLETHLVRQIRTWRPDVVFTGRVSRRSKDPLGSLVRQLTLSAVRRAADPTSNLELMTHTGLEPWQVKKVYAALGAGHTGSTSLRTGQLDPRLGRSPSDLASQTRGLILREHEPSPAELSFRLVEDHTSDGHQRQDFFAGIALAPGGEARRRLSWPDRPTLERLRRVAQKRRNMQQLLDRVEGDEQSGTAWAAQLDDVTGDLDAPAAAQILHQLAAQFQRRGRWELAAETLQRLAERYPRHPLTQSAQVWLVKYYGSGELAWRLRRQSGATVQQATAIVPSRNREQEPAGVRAGGGGVRAAGDAPQLAVSNFEGPIGSRTKFIDTRCSQASAIGKHLQRTQPVLYAEPSLRFALAAAHRKLGYPKQAERYFLELRQTAAHGAWSTCAEAERWLVERKDVSPKPIWTAIQASSPPHLDGRLDDPCWQQARKVALQSAGNDADAPPPAEARIAYDRRFLYIAVTCRKAKGATYPRPSGPRTRDPDLSSHDRVELLLDIDRDYATYYALSVDHRGQVRDACWGDATWNPTWYVATDSSNEQWTVEAAMPLAELTDKPPESNHIWALGIQRTVPGVGFQSWTRPAGPKIAPQGFGFLVFR